MAGVIQEIDLVLSQQTLARTIREAEAAGVAIGTGLAANASPAAQQFATKLLGTLQAEIQAKTETLGENLAAGVIDEAAFARQGALAGQQFIDKLRQGIASGTKLGLFAGEGGAALQAQLTGLVTALERTAAAAGQAGTGLRGTAQETDRLGQAARRATPAMNTLDTATVRVAGRARALNQIQNTLVGIALQATNTVGPFGKLASNILLFAGGGTVMLALAAAIGGVGLIVNKINEDLIKSRESADKLVEKFKDLGRTRLPEFQRIGLDIRAVRVEIDALEQRLDAVSKRRGLAFIGSFLLEQITGNVKEDAKRLEELRKILTELVGEQTDVAADKAKELAAKRNAMVVELTALVAASGDTAASAIIAQIGQLRAKFAELGKDLPAEMKAMFKKAMTALEAEFGATVVGESFVKQFRDIELSIVEGLGSAALQNIIGELDALRARIDSILATLPDSKAKNELETQRNAIIARRNQLQGKAVELASTENVIIHGTVEGEDDRAEKMKKRLSDLQLQAHAIQNAVTGALQLAEAFGLVDDSLGDVLGGLAQAASNVELFVEQMKSIGKPGGASTMDTIGTGIAIAGGLSQLLGGLFGESPEQKAFKEAIQKNEQAIRDLSENIKKLDGSIAGSALLGAKRGLEGTLAPERNDAIFGPEWFKKGHPGAKADPEALDRALRNLGSSLTELQDIANDLGIDIDELTRAQLTQLQRAIQETDLTAFTKTLTGQLDIFQRYAKQAGLTASETLTGIVAKAAGTSTAFDKIFVGLDLSTKEGTEEAHKRIVQALREVPLLTAEQLGDLSVDQYLDLIGQAGDLVGQGLDDLAQKVADAAASAAQHIVDMADQAARQMNARRQFLDLTDRDDPLQQIAGTAGTAILQGILRGLDLTKEADRDILDQHLQRLFQLVNDGLLTAEQLGGMSRDDFKAIILEWERLLDEERANEQERKEAATREQEQAAEDRQRAIEDRKRELEERKRALEEEARERLQFLHDHEQEQVDRRLEAEERKEIAELEKRARRLGGDPEAAIQRLLALLAEATLLEQGPLGEDSPLARDARRRAEEARREAERLIEQGEKLIGDEVTPGFTVQRTITESSAGHLISELQLQTNWLQRIHQALTGMPLGGIAINVESATPGNGAGPPRLTQPWIDAINHELAICYQRDALMSGNADLPR